MRTFAHIVNPLVVQPTSDLFIAQPITFETMRVARDFARPRAKVQLLTTQYPEDRSLIPDDFTRTPDLERSVLDCASFGRQRKLPLIGDIVSRLYEAAPDADYLIFTNNDIGLMPHFYATVDALIDAGHDALVINRLVITQDYRRLDEIPLMYAETGRIHEGHDCFVFRRDAFPHFKLGEVSVGIPYIGRVMVWNLFCFGRNFREFKASHLTFHLGDPPMKWQGGGQEDYVAHNKAAAGKVMRELEGTCGPETIKAMISAYPHEFNYG